MVPGQREPEQKPSSPSSTMLAVDITLLNGGEPTVTGGVYMLKKPKTR